MHKQYIPLLERTCYEPILIFLLDWFSPLVLYFGNKGNEGTNLNILPQMNTCISKAYTSIGTSQSHG